MKLYDKPEVWSREVEEVKKQMTGQTRRALTTVGFTQQQAEDLEPIINVWATVYMEKYMMADTKASVKSDNEDSADEADRTLDRMLKSARESRTTLSSALALWMKYQSFICEFEARPNGMDSGAAAMWEVKAVLWAQAAEASPFR